MLQLFDPEQVKLFIGRRNAVHKNHLEDFKIHNSLVYFYYLTRLVNKPAIFYFFLFLLKKQKGKNYFAKYILFILLPHTFNVPVFSAKMNYIHLRFVSFSQSFE